MSTNESKANSTLTRKTSSELRGEKRTRENRQRSCKEQRQKEQEMARNAAKMNENKSEGGPGKTYREVAKNSEK